jgi:hypothetical protein
MIKLFIMFLAFFGATFLASRVQAAQAVAFQFMGVNFTYVLCAGFCAVVLASRLKTK